MSNEQKPRSLFAAYSNSNEQLSLESDKQQTTTTTTTTTSSWLSNSSFKEKEKPKKRASDFFKIEDDVDNSKGTSPTTTTTSSITPITQKSIKTKRKSFIDSSDSSDSSDSDSSESSDDEGFTYNRKKFKKQQEKERKKEKREKRKKKRYSNNDKTLVTNDLFENKVNNEKYYIETIGDKSNSNTTVTAMNKLLPNYDYDNFIVLGLDNCKIGYSKKEGYKIEDIKSTTSSKKQNDQNRYFKNIQPSSSRQTFEKVKSIKNIPDPTISNDNEIKLIVNDDSDDDNGENNDNEETLERKLLKKNSELNKHVEMEPNNIEAWIRLVKFQDNFQQFSNKVKRSNIAMYEKQLAIYRNALLVNPDSELLTIEYLKLASKIWDQQKVLELWNKLIDKNSNGGCGISESLWKEYIEFCLSNFNEFTVGKMKDTIITVIKKMLIKRRSFKVRDINFMENVQSIEESILQFISQLTRFLIQAGFSERVIGIYQSLIEFNCFEPIQLTNESQATLLKEFKLFWSSLDHPKIGESNSVGWSKSYNKLMDDRINSGSNRSSNNGSDNCDINLDNLDNLSIEEIERLLKEQEDEDKENNDQDIFNIVYKSKDGNEEQQQQQEQQQQNLEDEDHNMVFEQNKSNENKFNEWGKKEIQFDKLNWLPLNVNDINLVGKEVNSNDTERVVLFNDFYELLFRFVKEENKVELVFQFLELLGVPITLDEKLPPRFPFNHPIRRESINSINTNNISLLFQHLKQQQPTPTTTTDWISTFNQITTITKLDNDKIKFIDCVFKLILESSGGIVNIKLKEKLYISYILFKASMISLEDAKIYTKSLCEKFKQQLIYFDIFAWLEIKCGKIQEAKKIYQTTCTYINQIKSTITQQQIDFIYREYLIMELSSIYSSIDKDPTILKRFIQSNHKPIELFIIPLHIIQCYIDNNTYKQYTTNNNITIEQRCQYLKFKFTGNNNSNSNSNSPDYILIMLIFELLYNGFNGFLIMFNQVLQNNQNIIIHSIQHELITIKSIEMVCKLSPLLSISTEPLKIKNLIISSLNQYYDHPILLSLFLNWESKNQLINRVRIYFDTNGGIGGNNNNNNSNTSCIFWLFAIRFEIYKLGSAQRIKSLFEKSIQFNSNCKHNNILWKLYIEFEVNRGRLKIAKSIYYRSIKELPYSKIIWLLPFTNLKLSTIFTNNELSDIIKLINEKGIRLRLSL